MKICVTCIKRESCNEPLHTVEKKLNKQFAFLPKKLHNGGWIWWKSVYHRSIYIEEVLGLFEWRSTVNEYYTSEEAAILKLRGRK